MRGDDRDIGRHAGFQFEIPVVHADDHVVGHHVLDADRRIPHLGHRALEYFVRIRVHAKLRRVPFRDAADVRLADVGVNLHLGQVLRDHKERRRLKAGHHGLPHIDVARHDYAVDQRIDCRVVEIDLGGGQRGLRLVHLGLRDLHLGFGIPVIRPGQIQFGLRDETLAAKPDRPIQLQSPLGEGGLGPG